MPKDKQPQRGINDEQQGIVLRYENIKKGLSNHYSFPI